MAKSVQQKLEELRLRVRQLEEKRGSIVDDLIERGADPEPSEFARAVRVTENERHQANEAHTEGGSGA